MKKLLPHCRQETFGDGAIVAPSSASDRLGNAATFALRSQVTRHALSVAIVKNGHPINVAATNIDRHGESPPREFGARAVVQGASDHSP